MKSLSTNPGAIPDRMLLANYYLGAGQPAEAGRMVQEILAINPDYDSEMASQWLTRAGAQPETIAQMAQGLQAAGLP